MIPSPMVMGMKNDKTAGNSNNKVNIQVRY